MFTSKQIVTASKLRKNFPSIARKIRTDGMPHLVTQKGNNPLVLVEAEYFEDLVKFRYEAEKQGFRSVPDDCEFL